MLILGRQDSFKWPVKFRKPVDGGTFENTEFIAQFKRLPQSRLDEISQAIGDGGLTDAVLVDEVLCGWADVKDLDGNDVPYNAVTRAQLLDEAGVRAALIRAYMDALAGGARKN
jgi:hypothetical protein